MNNPVPMTVTFETPVGCRFIRIEARTLEGNAAEILPDEMGFSVSEAESGALRGSSTGG